MVVMASRAESLGAVTTGMGKRAMSSAKSIQSHWLVRNSVTRGMVKCLRMKGKSAGSLITEWLLAALARLIRVSA